MYGYCIIVVLFYQIFRWHMTNHDKDFYTLTLFEYHVDIDTLSLTSWHNVTLTRWHTITWRWHVNNDTPTMTRWHHWHTHWHWTLDTGWHWFNTNFYNPSNQIWLAILFILCMNITTVVLYILKLVGCICGCIWLEKFSRFRFSIFFDIWPSDSEN